MVPEGMDLITRSLKSDLKDEIRLNSQVINVKSSKKGVKVMVDCVGISCSEESPYFEGDYLIVTTPVRLTQGIDFDPPLSQDKQYALRTSYMTGKEFTYHEDLKRTRNDSGIFLRCNESYSSLSPSILGEQRRSQRSNHHD